MADKAADAVVAPVETVVAPVENIYLDAATKEIVRVIEDTTYRYQINEPEFGLYVESKAYKVLNGRKSA